MTVRARFWTIVAAALALSSAAAHGQQRQILNRFSSWTLAKFGDLVSLSSETENIGVACSDSSLTYLTLVKISDQSSVVWNPDPKAFYFHFTAWADDGRPSDFSLLVRDKSDSTATGIVVLNPDFEDQHTRFWELLKSARSKFSYSTPFGTVSVSAVDLAPAIARFQEECAKLFVANANKKMREPIPPNWLKR